MNPWCAGGHNEGPVLFKEAIQLVRALPISLDGSLDGNVCSILRDYFCHQKRMRRPVQAGWARLPLDRDERAGVPYPSAAFCHRPASWQLQLRCSSTLACANIKCTSGIFDIWNSARRQPKGCYSEFTRVWEDVVLCFNRQLVH